MGDKKRTMRRLSLLLAVLMTVCLLPVTALAADPEENDALHLDKNVTLEDDGSYTITLDAYSTGETEVVTGVQPTDFIFILDVSRSMNQRIDTATGYSSPYEGMTDRPLYYAANDLGGGYIDTSWASNYKGYFESNSWAYATQGVNQPYGGNTVYKTRFGALSDALDKFLGQVVDNPPVKGAHRLYMYTFSDDVTQIYVSGQVSYPSTMLMNGVEVKEGGITADALRSMFYDPFNVRDLNGNGAVDNAELPGARLVGFTKPWVAIDNSLSTTASHYGTDHSLKGIKDSVFADENRKKVIIFFTDGIPSVNDADDFSDTDALMTLRAFSDYKNAPDTVVYSILLNTDDFLKTNILDGEGKVRTPDFGNEVNRGKANSFLNLLSSNYSYTLGEGYDYNGVVSAAKPEKVNDGYVMTASTASALEEVFERISKETASTSVKLTDKAVLKDVISSAFRIPEGFTAADNVTARSYACIGAAADGTLLWSDAPEEKDGAPIDYPVTLGENSDINVSGFAYNKNYVVQSQLDGTWSGSRLSVTIRGIVPADAGFDGIVGADGISTNGEDSGIYPSAGAKEPAVRFVNPKVALGNMTYVIDYAKPITTEIKTLGIDKVTNLTEELSFFDPAEATTKLPTTVNGGTVTTSEGGYLKTVTYIPTSMEWKGFDRLYAFGKQLTTIGTDDTAAPGDVNMWARLLYVPASNVYYEDDFLTAEATEDSPAIRGIVYSSEGWTTVGTSSGNTEVNNTVHGGAENTDLADDRTFSDAMAHMSTSALAKASFTFRGDGVDIYSRVDKDSASVLAALYRLGTDAQGNESRTLVKIRQADGRSYALSGGYYQIPTLFFNDLTYGRYAVDLYVADTGTGLFTYYLDGIRIYDPVPMSELREGAETAYTSAGEYAPVYLTVRDALLDNVGTDEDVKGVVFIDKNADATLADEADITDTYTDTAPETEIESAYHTLGVYNDLGPKNEVYLGRDQAITFRLDTDAENCYLGLKSPSGSSVTVWISGADAKTEKTIAHTTDLYYKVFPDANGLITVQNKSDAVLAVTKVRLAGSSAEPVTGSFGSMDGPTLKSSLRSFFAAPAYEYKGEAAVEAFTTLDMTEGYALGGETPLGGVTVENPDPVPSAPAPSVWQSLADRLFSGFRGWAY